MTPPEISVVGGKTQYKTEAKLDFKYPVIAAIDSSGDTAGITRLDNLDNSKTAGHTIFTLPDLVVARPLQNDGVFNN